VMVRDFFIKLRLLLYWGLPPVLLYVIFSRIDIKHLIDLASIADHWLILIGTTFIGFKILAGALRWHYLARHFDCTRMSLRTSIAEYWISLTLGVVIPGSLGSDAYRIALGGKQTGRYLRGAFVIGVEKIAALIACAAFVVVLYPMLDFKSLPDAVIYIFDAAYGFLLIGAVLVLMLAVTHRAQWLTTLANNFAQKISALAKRAGMKPDTGHQRDQMTDGAPLDLVLSVFKPGVVLPVLAFSFALQIIGAVTSQLFFQALGYDLPFLVNLFVAPLILLAFTLPISIGGLGIRESVHILFYGAFGVPAETALLVSFCGLSSLLLGHAVGVLIFVARRPGQAG
jgi:glycosyltransferase 2 family protein